MSDNEIVTDFLAESHENLDRLDRELVDLEKAPDDGEALAGVFRTIHTIKGTCGFLGFNKLEKVAHSGENLLAILRDGRLALNPEITTALLRMVDAIREMLSEIKSTGQDGNGDYAELLETLAKLQTVDGSTVSAPRVEQRGGAPANGEPPSKKNAPGVVESQQTGDSAPSPVQQQSVTQSAASSQPAPPSGGIETVRVGVNLLDNLMTLVGELVLARNQLLQFTHRVEDAHLHGVSQRMNLIATELQEQVMKTRLQPIGNIWSQFPRTVRDVAVSVGKEVRIEMEGKETELDKTIIEAIKDPLTHLVRNSIDHGIEVPEERIKAGKNGKGCLTLRAFHEGGQVNIEISDDGAGLNRDRILQKAIERGLVTADHATRMADSEVLGMIFLPGFSTAQKITNVSGRGVGMDVVKTNVEKIGGAVDVQSKPGQGTTVRIKIPLTLAIIPALIVTCGEERFAIPQVNLTELVRAENNTPGKKIELVHGAPVYRLRGRLLPLVYLRHELQLPAATSRDAEPAGAVNIVVLQAGEREFGLVVDQVNDTQEIVVKPLRKKLKGIKTFAGATIMGDGKIALILDVMGVAQRSGVASEVRDRVVPEKTVEAAAKNRETRTFLLFAGPDDARMAMPIEVLDRLEELSASQMEQSGRHWVAQYRGAIIPLVHLGKALDERRKALRRNRKHSDETADTGSFQVLVCHNEGQTVGIVVERIIDIVEDYAEVRYPTSREGILYSAVINGRVTELIDVPALLRSSGIHANEIPCQMEMVR